MWALLAAGKRAEDEAFVPDQGKLLSGKVKGKCVGLDAVFAAMGAGRGVEAIFAGLGREEEEAAPDVAMGQPPVFHVEGFSPDGAIWQKKLSAALGLISPVAQQWVWGLGKNRGGQKKGREDHARDLAAIASPAATPLDHAH